jgi:protein-S-isoprenylcysteine O-methyltransferase Ste14
VRHPIYTGMLLALLGTTLVASTVGSVLGFVLAIISLWQKARMEERFLMVEFRELYTNYQREVKFLIPFIY